MKASSPQCRYCNSSSIMYTDTCTNKKERLTTVPQVFGLKTEGDVSAIACLAKDFYPKNVEIYLNNIKQENVSTFLSKEGLYSAVSVRNGKTDDFTCEVKQKQSRITTSKGEEEEESTDSQCVRTDNTGAQSTEQINLLSLTVLGMRALFAKILAFNLLLSAKIFIM